jgi:nudix-type nucleoside diphosphatase (YffH/AdpP family)
MLLEVPAGLLDQDDPETAIRREAAEETGVSLESVTHLFTSFMSPGSVTETIDFYAAPYQRGHVTGKGGGLRSDGEDIEVVEMLFDDAFEGIFTGTIVDAKTIMLLQWALLRGPFAATDTHA